MSKLRKTIIVISGAVVVFIAVVVIIISPVTKYIIEKYDTEFLGRQITLDWAYVNPFTGYIHLSNVEIFELNTDSVFFSSKGISADFSMMQLCFRNFEISTLSLNQPFGKIIQKDSSLNFDDLIVRFSQKKSHKKREPVHFSILDLQITNGQFLYIETVIPIHYDIKNVELNSTGFQWDTDTVSSLFSFSQGMGSGDVKGDFMINLKNRDYRLAVVVRQMDLYIFQQYLKDLSNYGNFSAILDVDMKSSGNLDDARDMTTSGYLNLSDFHFGKTPQDDYAAFDNLIVNINELSPQKQVYSFDTISLTHPYFKYEKYDDSDNLRTMFERESSHVEDGSNSQFNLILEIADYIKVLSKNFFQSDYKINSLSVYKADIKYNDYSLSEKFSIDLNPLTITADSIDKKRSWVHLSLLSDIKPYGDISVALSIDPHDSSDFDLKYRLNKLPASLFNPYIISQTSFPLDRGTIEIDGDWKVRNGDIQSSNHLVIIDPRLAKRLKNDELDWIPLKPIMTLVRERGNIIDYEIPISGNLKDPKFKAKDVIFDIIENIFIKPVLTNYIIQVKSTEKTIEKSLELTWEMHDSGLSHVEKRFIKDIAGYLKEHPEASISVSPFDYTLKEKEYILLNEAKKMYFISADRSGNSMFDQSDSIAVERLSIRDKGFTGFLNSHVSDSLVFNIQKRSERLVQTIVINEIYEQLKSERINVFMSYFKEQGVEKQVSMQNAVETIPYNGFSFYKIAYEGELPDYLLKAYQKIDQFNNKPPRKKNLGKRRKIQNEAAKR